MIILGLIALIVIPPEKLPDFARQVARLFGDLRRSTSGLLDELKQEALLKPEDLLKYHANKPKEEQSTENQGVNQTVGQTTSQVVNQAVNQTDDKNKNEQS